MGPFFIIKLIWYTASFAKIFVPYDPCVCKAFKLNLWITKRAIFCWLHCTINHGPDILIKYGDTFIMQQNSHNTAYTNSKTWNVQNKTFPMMFPGAKNMCIYNIL